MKFCVIFGSDPYHIVQFMVRRGSLSLFCALLRHFRNCAFCRIPFNTLRALQRLRFSGEQCEIFRYLMLTYLLTYLFNDKQDPKATGMGDNQSEVIYPKQIVRKRSSPKILADAGSPPLEIGAYVADPPELRSSPHVLVLPAKFGRCGSNRV